MFTLKRVLLLILVLLWVVCLAGCFVYSVNGLVDEKVTPEFDASILGTYYADDGSLIIEPQNDDEYLFTFSCFQTEKNGTCEPRSFRARRVRIGGDFWMDFEAADLKCDDLCLPLHFFARVFAERDKLSLFFLNEDQVKTALDGQDGRIEELPRRKDSSSDVHLISKPEALREFLKLESQAKDGLGDPLILQRKSSESGAYVKPPPSVSPVPE
jgi:hypothetical protein